MQELNYEKLAFSWFVLGGVILAAIMSCIASLIYSDENLSLLNFSFFLHKNLLLFILFFIPSVISFLYLKFIKFKLDRKVFYNLFIMPFGEVMIAVLLHFLLNEGVMIHEFARLFVLIAPPIFAVSIFQIICAKFAFKG